MSRALISRRFLSLTSPLRNQLKYQSTLDNSTNNDDKNSKVQKTESSKEIAGYDYFRSLTELANNNPIAISQQLDDIIKEKHFTAEHKKLENLKPVLPSKSVSLAAYANESEVIKKFLQLGVNLRKIEENHPKMSNMLLKLDFETDIQPMLFFLCDNAVEKKDLGKMITKCPEIFDSDYDMLQENINYFISKKFTKQAIGRILTKAPKVVIRSVREIDKNLGFLQKEFTLLGDEVRDSVTKHPKLITFNRKFIHVSKFSNNFSLFKNYRLF